MKRVLLVEDSVDVGEVVKLGLSHYFVEQALTLAEAEKSLKENNYDLLLIDGTLADGDGFDLCLRLSSDLKYERIPKILLTARVGTADKIHGFSCGASDYVTKPFHFLELKARVDRYLAREPLTAQSELTYGCFIFNPAFQRCMIAEDGTGAGRRDLGLTPTEFRLFLALVRAEGEPLSRQILEKAVWESNGAVIQARGIDTHIAHLRKKLGKRSHMIGSVYGKGYVFTSGSRS